MEQDHFQEMDLNYYKLEYINQNIENNTEFKKWYEEANEICKNKNLQTSKLRDDGADKLFTIALCKECSSYTICSIGFRYCFFLC